jgi:ABC-2 type transport system permease protein
MNIFLIFKRDFLAYLHGFAGYAIIAAVLFIDGVLFNAFAMGSGAKYSHEVLEQFFYFSSGTTMIAAILLTMRSIAEERQNGTDVLFRNAPISDGAVIIGKYLAAMGVLTLMTALTAYMPAMIMINGKISVEHILVGYLGLLGLGSAASAIGLFGSTLFRNQVGAAIVSGVMLVTLLICWLLSELTDPPFTEVLAYAALFDKHFLPFMEGRLLTSGLVYYASVTFVFLWLSTKVLEGRRWQ